MATITKVGSYTGNGAALNISVGFIPDHVRIVNTTTVGFDEWYQGMAAGTSVTAATDVAAGAVRAAPGGVTAFAGSGDAGEGFTVGAALSAAGAVYRYIAVQNGPGAA